METTTLQPTTTLAPIYNIGDYAFGGIITYIFKKGDTNYISGETHGFVVSTEDLGISHWGHSGNTYASGITIGTGYQNTLNIIEKCGDDCAAKLCVNYSGSGYNDWFLPSHNEALMFCPLHWLGFGNFTTGVTDDICSLGYYTSTEISPILFHGYDEYKSAFIQNINFEENSWDNGNPKWKFFGGNEKSFLFFVRAIRYF